MQILTNLATTFLGALGISMLMMTQLLLPRRPGRPLLDKSPLPRLGGIAIFISFIFASAIGLYNLGLKELTYIISATMLIFFIGLKDDILSPSPYKKIIPIVTAALMVTFPAKIRITNLHGFVGIETIGAVPGVIITFIFVILIINTFSLIDDKHGPTTILSMVLAIGLGIWFATGLHTQYAILSISLVGSVAGFSIYNYYDKQNMIALGNIGALFLGLVIAVLLIRFNELAVFKIPNSGIITALVLLPVSAGILFIIRAGIIHNQQLSKAACQDRQILGVTLPHEITRKRRIYRRKRDKGHNPN